MSASRALLIPDILERVLSFLSAAVEVPRDGGPCSALSEAEKQRPYCPKECLRFSSISSAYSDPFLCQNPKHFEEAHDGQSLEEHLETVKMYGYPIAARETSVGNSFGSQRTGSSISPVLVTLPREQQATVLSLCSLCKDIRRVASSLDFWKHRWYYYFNGSAVCRRVLQAKLDMMTPDKTCSAKMATDLIGLNVNWLHLLACCAATLFECRWHHHTSQESEAGSSTGRADASKKSTLREQSAGLLSGFIATVKRQIFSTSSSGRSGSLLQSVAVPSSLAVNGGGGGAPTTHKTIFLFSLAPGLYVVHDFMTMITSAASNVPRDDRGNNALCSVTLLGFELRKVRLRQLHELVSSADRIDAVWFLGDARHTLKPPTVVLRGHQHNAVDADDAYQLGFSTESPFSPSTFAQRSDDLDEFLYAIYKNPFLAPLFRLHIVKEADNVNMLLRPRLTPLLILLGCDVPVSLSKGTEMTIDSAHRLVQELLQLMSSSIRIGRSDHSTYHGEYIGSSVCGATLSMPSSLRRLLELV
ncbi:Hypothetical protein, putative [Bodo saltans]|uniref:Uncharacterized protein n=1 Tax=Bodo saltans TaxID=75058 RepID=A0A0S4JTJ2_BODSA|nr:Hypothetical protein, putative [Bodo saltans]|eukprot:CUG93606.1 Hypothetical protein, putative [Bodo saltans]